MSDPAADQTPSASEYEQERRKKRDTLVEAGQDVYGRRTEGIKPIDQLPTPTEAEGGPVVKVAGRIVLKRDMGKLSFLTIRDDTGDVQIGLQKNRLSEGGGEGWLVRNNLDLGDLIVCEGGIGLTKTGQPTIWADSVSMASKSLVVPPDKHKGMTDPELRYRQRYVDLWANPESMDVMKKRFAIIDAMRKYLRDRGFVEVETPMLQPIHGGAAARPFETHHNAYDIPLYLRIAPELYLKRLLVGGMPKVFEINRNFRNEGVSPRHNPEFTMLEAYEAYGNWETMAELVEDMICTVAMDVLGTTKITLGAKSDARSDAKSDAKSDASPDREGGVSGDGAATSDDAEPLPHGRGSQSESDPRVIDLGKRPWRRVALASLVEEKEQWKFRKIDVRVDAPRVAAELIYRRIQGTLSNLENVQLVSREDGTDMTEWVANEARRIAIEFCKNEEKPENDKEPFIRGWVQEEFEELGKISPAEQLVEAFERLIESTLTEPTYVTRVPSVIIPLARPCEDDDYFADVYELAIGGQEISPGYTELNDPDVQARLFREQAVEDEGERQKVDHDFLHALKVGMPPAGGMGLGVDRLVMLLLGQPSIRDVLAFPLMKPNQETSKG